jgi:hypothetical protein
MGKQHLLTASNNTICRSMNTETVRINFIFLISLAGIFEEIHNLFSVSDFFHKPLLNKGSNTQYYLQNQMAGYKNTVVNVYLERTFSLKRSILGKLHILL